MCARVMQILSQTGPIYLFRTANWRDTTRQWYNSLVCYNFERGEWTTYYLYLPRGNRTEDARYSKWTYDGRSLRLNRLRPPDTCLIQLNVSRGNPLGTIKSAFNYKTPIINTFKTSLILFESFIVARRRYLLFCTFLKISSRNLPPKQHYSHSYTCC